MENDEIYTNKNSSMENCETQQKLFLFENGEICTKIFLLKILKYHDFLFSGDDSVTLPDSTQPEEPVG